MNKATKNGIDYIITATNEDNDRQIEQMVGKAMCAYANWQGVEDDRDQLTTLYGINAVEKSITAHKSEYEATIRCIAMFVEQPTSYICHYVIARCFEEFGI